MTTELIEVMPFEYQIIESANGRFRVEGVFQRSDIENANKRVYPRTIWEKELKEPRVREVLESRAMFGELDHPSDGKTSLKRVSHLITGLNLQEDGTVTGSAEILPTPNGQILKALFESGAQVGISSRGSGSVSNGVVQEDFKLSTFDFVARPSTPGAVPKPVGETQRSRSKFFEDDEAKDELVTVNDDEFNSFLKSLEDIDLTVLETDNNDLNALAHDIITVHNFVMENEMTPETINEVSGYLVSLGTDLGRMAVDHPEQRTIIADLLEKVEQTRGAVISKPHNQVTEEENMDKLEFIKARLNESAEDEEMVLQETAANLYDELNSLSDEELVAIAQQVDSDRLREHLETLSDDELIEAGIEAGVLTEDNATGDDEEVTVQDLLDYVEHLEGQLQEAEEIVGELVGRLEESGDADTALLKYEAALEIIQETVGRFQLLQEAVGGEDRANQLMESYVAKLEAENDTESNDINVVESVLNEDGSAGDNKMNEYLRLTEGALARLGAR